MKYTDGFTKLTPSIITVILMIGSFGLLSIALKHIPLSTAYAAWTGIGIAGTFLFGYIILHESITLAHGICISLIMGGIIGLRLLAP